MTVAILKASTESLDGRDADGWVLIIQLFRLQFEISAMWVK